MPQPESAQPEQAQSIYGLADYLHIDDLEEDVGMAEAFERTHVVARYIEAVTAGNIALVTPGGVTRVLPFTAGQYRILQFTAIEAEDTTVTAVVVGY